jgi:hypothetical protein
MTEYFSFKTEPPEWGKKLGEWFKSAWSEIKWFFHDFDATAFAGLILIIVLTVVMVIFGIDLTSERIPVGDPYPGIIVGHTITGDNRDSKVVSGINTEGEATVYVIPGESEKRKIAVDIGVYVIEFTATPTEYYRTFLGMEVVVQKYSTPRGLIQTWRISEYAETN